MDGIVTARTPRLLTLFDNQNTNTSTSAEISQEIDMTSEMEQLYRAALNADQAWSEVLKRQFGCRAGDARYDRRGVSTPELTTLQQNFRVANDAWLDAVRRRRSQDAV